MGVRVVKAFARQDYETEKFAENNTEKLRRGQAHDVPAFYLLAHFGYHLWLTTCDQHLCRGERGY